MCRVASQPCSQLEKWLHGSEIYSWVMGSEISLIPTYVWTSPSILPFLKSHFTLLVSAKSHFRRVRSTTAQWGGKVEFGYVSKLVKWVWWWRGRRGGCSDSLHRWLASRYTEVTSANWLQGWLATQDCWVAWRSPSQTHRVGGGR